MKRADTRHIPPNTAEEEAAIQAGIDSDPDTIEWTEEIAARARPASEVLPPELYQRLTRGRGPQKAPTKELVSIRLDRDVLDHFRDSGPGWQGRMNEALRKSIG